MGVPDGLQSLELAPRHLSLLSYLLFDGPLTVSELAERLQVAPTTVSLLVSELAGKGVLTRREDDTASGTVPRRGRWSRGRRVDRRAHPRAASARPRSS